MTAFPRTFGMAIACNLKLLVRLRLYLSGFLHILHSMLPTMQGSLKSINIYIYKEKSTVSIPKRKAFQRRAGILNVNGEKGGGGGVSCGSGGQPWI